MPDINLISSKSIVAKVYRDFNVPVGDWELDAIEWIGEGLSAIGGYKQSIDKSALLEISSFKAQLPYDYVSMRKVVYSKNKNTLEEFREGMKDKLDYSTEPFNRANDVNNISNARQISKDDYMIDHNYIKLGFEEGYIYIAYKSIPLDNEGYPMVPDMFDYKEALSYLILVKLLSRGVSLLSPIDFKTAYQLWLKHCNQAYTVISMPTEVEAEELHSLWLAGLQYKKMENNTYRENVYNIPKNEI